MKNMLRHISKLDPKYIGQKLIENENSRSRLSYLAALYGELVAAFGSAVVAGAYIASKTGIPKYSLETAVIIPAILATLAVTLISRRSDFASYLNPSARIVDNNL